MTSRPPIVYLDQNKWIELARMHHSKDTSDRARAILCDFEQARRAGSAVFPLSSFHYTETARIANTGRKGRLGATMWHFSQGVTLLAYETIVRHEVEVALSKHVAKVHPGPLKLLGRGHAHAFASSPLTGLLKLFEEQVERSLLTGHDRRAIPPPAFHGTSQRENFKRHLSTLRERLGQVPPAMWETFLYALLTDDIKGPISEVMVRHGVDKAVFSSLGAERLKQVIDDMPTRRLDLHLHRQVLRNPNYVARPTDLEDWGGLALASCYCDVVVCERHMADMLRRDGNVPAARIEVRLDDALPLV